MKKRLFASFIASLILIAAAGLLRPLKVFAASGSIGFLIEETEINVNQTFSVYLTIDADVDIGDFGCYIYYDESKLQYRSGSDCVQGGDGYLKISVSNATTSSDNKKILMKFIAKAPGTVVFSASNAKLYDFENGAAVSLSVSDASVTVKAAPEASTNSSLKSLRVSPGSLSPAFSKDVYEYRVEVGKDTGSIYVSAIAEDTEKATVGIYGYEHIYPGENTVTILVTAEDGSKTEYKIIVTKLETNAPTATPSPSPSPTPTETPVPEKTEFEWKVEAFEENGGLYLTGNYKFTIVDKPSGVSIPTGHVETKLMISGRAITVYAPDTTDVVNYVLIYLKHEGDEAAFYKYDRIEKTIQRYNQDEIIIKREDDNTVSEQVLNQLNEYQNTISLLGFIIAGVVAVWLLTCLGLVYFIRRAKGLDDFDE